MKRKFPVVVGCFLITALSLTILNSCTNDPYSVEETSPLTRSEHIINLNSPNSIFGAFIIFEDNQAVLNLSRTDALSLGVTSEDYDEALLTIEAINDAIEDAIENGATPVFPNAEPELITRQSIIAGETGQPVNSGWSIIRQGNIAGNGHYNAQWTSYGYGAYRCQVVVSSQQFVWSATVSDGRGGEWVVGGTLYNPGVVDLSMMLSYPENNWNVTVQMNGPNGYGGTVTIYMP